ncbi:MAG: hypothetical protein HPAVJP_5510 [Candidatus Hepatoplasma vulgare]|nr:MAG: hypothetical protein HPAVJP_5510 [Candidatus Hepatoplasma sp.]
MKLILLIIISILLLGIFIMLIIYLPKIEDNTESQVNITQQVDNNLESSHIYLLEDEDLY